MKLNKIKLNEILCCFIALMIGYLAAKVMSVNGFTIGGKYSCSGTGCIEDETGAYDDNDCNEKCDSWYKKYWWVILISIIVFVLIIVIIIYFAIRDTNKIAPRLPRESYTTLPGLRNIS